MSIYENSTDIKTKATKRDNKGEPSQKVDPKKILNDKSLSDLVKQMKSTKGLNTAKEVLYDSEENIVGILQRNNSPYLFNEKEQKEFLSLYKEN